jgi:putative membrane protein
VLDFPGVIFAQVITLVCWHVIGEKILTLNQSMKPFSLLTGSLLVFICGCNKNNDDDNTINATDAAFVTKASLQNNAEVDGGETALAKATDPKVANFGFSMTIEHGMARTELQTLSASLGLTCCDSIDAAHAALKERLNLLSGNAFDSTYIHSQVNDQQAMMQFFQEEINNGVNYRLIDFAKMQMPRLLMHLQRADSIAAHF